MDVDEELQWLVDRAFGSYVDNDVIVLGETIAEEGVHDCTD